MSANKTESDSKLDLITEKLNSLDTVDSKLVELKSIIENLEVSGGGSGNTSLEEDGFCIVTYKNFPSYDENGEKISDDTVEIVKKGSIVNFNNYIKRLNRYEHINRVFAGFSKKEQYPVMELTITESCTLYPIYVDPAECTLSYVTTLENPAFSEEHAINFGIGTPIWFDTVTGQNPIIIGYAENPDSINPMQFPSYRTYAIILTRDGKIHSCRDFTENHYITKKYGQSANFEAPFTYINDNGQIVTEEHKMYEMINHSPIYATYNNTTYVFKGWTGVIQDTIHVVPSFDDYLCGNLRGDEIEYGIDYHFYAIYEPLDSDGIETGTLINVAKIS